VNFNGWSQLGFGIHKEDIRFSTKFIRDGGESGTLAKEEGPDP
jgi:hypothetical protein